MKIGFALITKAPFFNEIVRIENEVHDICGFMNKLGLVKNIPHTTLFQGSFSEQVDYKSILKEIKKYFCDSNQDKKLHFDEVIYVPEGWYFYACKKTDRLQELHNMTLELCKKDIVLEADRLANRFLNLPQIQIDGIAKYGYRYSEEAFLPHITIGRSVSKEQDIIMQLLTTKFQELPRDVEIERLTVYRMGENGVHAETLDEIWL